MLPFFSTIGLGEEKDYFIENLAMLLSSGMTVSLALPAIKSDIRSPYLRKTIETLEADIYGGSSMATALEKTGLFPDHVIALIRIGEVSGRLPENLEVVVTQLAKERELRSKITSAMMYPVFVFSLTAIIGLGVAWFLLPRLATVFAELDVELPLITKVLIALGNFLGSYGLVAVPCLIIIFFWLIFFIFFYDKTRYLGQALLMNIPGIKKLVQEIELARLGFILGTLLGVGLPVPDAISSLEAATPVYAYKDLYKHLAQSIAEGNTFYKCFQIYQGTGRLIPAPIQGLVAIGEQSGRLPQVLVKIGQTFEAKTDLTTKNLTVILEPVLLVIVWLGVVAVALAVILPIYSLIGGLSK